MQLCILAFCQVGVVDFLQGKPLVWIGTGRQMARSTKYEADEMR